MSTSLKCVSWLLMPHMGAFHRMPVTAQGVQQSWGDADKSLMQFAIPLDRAAGAMRLACAAQIVSATTPSLPMENGLPLSGRSWEGS